MTQDTERTRAEQEIQQLSKDLYGDRSLDRAFAHWVLKCLLADVEPNDSILRDQTAISGPGDIGIDAWWIDYENSRLILVQAKGTRVRRKEAQEFRGAIEALADESFVRANANAALREVCQPILDCIYDESYSVHAVLACRDRVMPAAGDYVKTAGYSEWQLRESDVVHMKELTMEALSVLHLVDRRHQLSLHEAPHVVLPIAFDGDRLAFHYMSGPFKSVLATVPASALAEAYSKHRSAIFQFNPRGPQGSNKVNKDVLYTLNDDVMKEHFHLLNNGITVVCEALTINEDQHSISMHDFQIVNGCQTVYTLFQAPNLSLKVQVNVRIIEGLQNLVKQIANASNSQTAVKAEQLSSLGPEHDRITRELEIHSPPWYYEKQLGRARLYTETRRRAHRDKFGTRAVKITEIGQYGASFLGYPAMAKYDLKGVFEKRGVGSLIYRALFLEENTGDQLLLPVLVGQRVFQSVKEKLSTTRAAKGLNEEAFTELDWAPYARIHLIGLVGCVCLQRD